MTRCWMLTFRGKPRNKHLYENAHEAPLLYGPLVVLAIPSIIGGYIGIREMLWKAMSEGNTYVQEYVLPVNAGHEGAEPGKNNIYGQVFPDPEQKKEAAGGGAAHEGAQSRVEVALDEGEKLVQKFVRWAFAIGIGAGF